MVGGCTGLALLCVLCEVWSSSAKEEGRVFFPALALCIFVGYESVSLFDGPFCDIDGRILTLRLRNSTLADMPGQLRMVSIFTEYSVVGY